MSEETLKFNNIKVNKKEFHKSKQSILLAQKAQKTHISKQKQKKVVLNALKKHLRRRKFLIHIFYAFYALFVLFCVLKTTFLCA